jgi:hypothetical protein
VATLALVNYHAQVTASVAEPEKPNEFTTRKRCEAFAEIVERLCFDINVVEKKDVAANYLRLLSTLITGFKKCQSGVAIPDTSIFSKASCRFYLERKKKVQQILDGFQQLEGEKGEGKANSDILTMLPEIKAIGEQILAFCNGL